MSKKTTTKVYMLNEIKIKIKKREREKESIYKKKWDINHLNILFDVKTMMMKRKKRKKEIYFHILAMFCMFRFAYFQLIEK